jgi:nitrite reductase (NADH) large subunit
MKIGIIGAGHAGVAAAQAVAKAGHQVTLFSNESCLPYFRPRIPGIAFGQISEEESTMYPMDWYSEQNIDLKIGQPAIRISADKKIISKSNQEHYFDKILITAGASPIIPPFARNCSSGLVIPLWSMKYARAIKAKLSEIRKIVIIGGGVIGIEAALRAVDAGLSVTIIERNNYLMERNLSNRASILLAQTLEGKGIKLLTGCTVESIDDTSKTVNITTDKLDSLKTELVILSIGNTFNLQFAEHSGLEKDRAIIVDTKMQSTNKDYFAAGDIAQLPNIINVCSAIKAVKQGKVAGTNSVSSEMVEFNIEPVSVLLKYKDFQLYAIGETLTDGFKEEILDNTNSTYRALVKKNDKIVGIQMIGDLTDYKKFEKELIV